VAAERRGRRGGLAALLGAAATLALAPAAPAEPAPDACPRFRQASEGLPTSREWRTHPAFGDVNGDGHLDLAAHPRKGAGPRVWLGDGGRSWTPASEGLVIPGGTCGVGVELADLDGDGHLDLGVADHCYGPFVFFGDGAGSWRLGPLVDPSDPKGLEDLAFGDVTGDGIPDLVGVGSFRGGLVAYRGDGAGGWEAIDLGLPSRGTGNGVALADLDGDGRLDVAAALSLRRSAPGPVWLSRGAETYGPASEGIVFRGTLHQVAVGDVNGDGHLDVAFTADFWPGNRPVGVFLGDGAGGWTPAQEGLPPPMKRGEFTIFYGLALGDLDGDGHADLVAMDHRTGALRVWLGDGAGAWRACPDVGGTPERDTGRGWGIALGDVDGDGRPDLAAGYGSSPKGSLEVWLQEAPAPRGGPAR